VSGMEAASAAPTEAVVQGAVLHADDSKVLAAAVEEAFGYRGDVTVTMRDGRTVEGYLFDRRAPERGADGSLRILVADGTRVRIGYAEVATIAFTGRDTAAGKTWENWVRKYAQKKLAGEAASIESDSGE